MVSLMPCGRFRASAPPRIGTCPRVYLLRDVGLFPDVNLRVAGDTRGEVRRQRDGLFPAVVAGLGAEPHPWPFDGGAGHAVLKGGGGSGYEVPAP